MYFKILIFLFLFSLLYNTVYYLEFSKPEEKKSLSDIGFNNNFIINAEEEKNTPENSLLIKENILASPEKPNKIPFNNTKLITAITKPVEKKISGEISIKKILILNSTETTQASRNSPLDTENITESTESANKILISNKNSSTIQNNSVECPLIPPNLGTRIKIDNETKEFSVIEKKMSQFNIDGGMSRPENCIAHVKVAIIIPYRDREANLKIFLNHMHPFLKKQQLDYGIFLIEPLENLQFNRGLLMNIGFLESLKLTNDYWDCFIFHDVDLIPEDERNIYNCAEQPRHMSAAVSTMKYKLPYATIFGGVTAIKKEHYKKSNGFSNCYFGWGGEDDDFRQRFINKGFKIERYPLEIGRYYMARHQKDRDVNRQRFNLLRKTGINQMKDGINSILYNVTKVEKNKLFTKVYVNYDKKAILKTIE